MITTILNLRVKQGLRLLCTVGLFMTLAALLVFSGIGFQFLGTLLGLEAWWSIPLISLLLNYLHFSRKDLIFLSGLMDRLDYHIILSIEYFLITLPVFVYQLWKGHLMIALGLGLVCVFISFVPKFNTAAFLKSRSISFDFVPLELYEIRIIIERYWLPFIGFWLMSFFGFFHEAFFLLALFFSLTIILGGFVHNEPIETMTSKGDFLHEKLGINLGFCALIFIVQFGLALYFHPDAYLVLLYGYLYFFVILGLAICYKYANYDPLRMSTLNANFVGIVMILSLLPGFILVAIVAFIYYYFSAQRSLSYYL